MQTPRTHWFWANQNSHECYKSIQTWKGKMSSNHIYLVLFHKQWDQFICSAIFVVLCSLILDVYVCMLGLWRSVNIFLISVLHKVIEEVFEKIIYFLQMNNTYKWHMHLKHLCRTLGSFISDVYSCCCWGFQGSKHRLVSPGNQPRVVSFLASLLNLQNLAWAYIGVILFKIQTVKIGLAVTTDSICLFDIIWLFPANFFPLG